MDMNEEYGLTPYETREILFYKTDNGEVRVEILLYQENLWLTQAKMAELFEVQKAAISKTFEKYFYIRRIAGRSSCFQNGNNCGRRQAVQYKILQSGCYYCCRIPC